MGDMERRRMMIGLKYLNSKDISEMLGLCYQKTLDFIKYSGIQYVKIGRIYRVRSDVFEKFVEENNTIDLTGG